MLRAGNFFSRWESARRQRGISRLPRTRWLSLESLEPRQLLAADVIVSELMYHPPSAPNAPEDTGQEFIELFNRGDAAANLLDWRFTSGVDFVFPDVSIGAGEYLVVVADPTVFNTTHPEVTNYFSHYGWVGQLSNSGEQVKLEDALGATVDLVRYADEGDWSVREKVLDLENHDATLGDMEGYDWSDLHDGGGRSLELINPAMTNNSGQNWAASQVDGGTPGAANTVAATDIAPLIRNVEHFPIIPTSTDEVTVVAKVQDELATGINVVLRYRDDGDSSFNTTTMFDDGLHGDELPGDGIYGGQIVARPDGTIVEFYVEATDAGANTRSWPMPVEGIDEPGEPRGANALYQVDNSFTQAWTPGDQPVFRIIMPVDDWAYFKTWADISGRDFKPNGQMNATFISTDGASMQVRYRVGVRNRGNGSRAHLPHNLRVNFPHDEPWQGYKAVNFNAQQPYSQILGSAIFRYADIPAADGTQVEIRVNGVNRADAGVDMYGSYDWIEVPDGDLVANHWPADSNGNLYKCNYYLPGGRTDATLEYFDDNPNSYRNEYNKQTNVAADDFSGLIHMLDVLNNAPAATYFDDVSEVINVREWVRFMAIDTLLSNNEGGLITGSGDDYMMYQGVLDPRFLLLPYDLDSITVWGGSTTRSIWSYRNPALPGLYRLLTEPQVAQIYYQELLDLCNTVFAPETINPLVDQLLDGWIPAGDVADIKQFFVNRVANVRTQIVNDPLTVQSSLPVVGGYHRTTSDAAVLSGEASIAFVQSVLVDGQPADWDLGSGTWSIGAAGNATQFTFQDGSGGYAGTSDTRIFANDAVDANHGAETDLQADLSTGGVEAQSLLRFDDIFGSGAGQVALTDEIASATLTLSARDSGQPFTLHRMLATWDEAANWHTFGGDGVQANDTEAAAAVDATINVNGAGLVTVDVTQAVMAWQTAERENQPSNHGWALLATGTDGSRFDSSEVSDVNLHPKLTITLDDADQIGVPLTPGLNRVLVQAFDGEDGTGNELDRTYIDIWSDSAPLQDYPRADVPTASSVNMLVRDSYLPGTPVLVRVEALDENGNVYRDLWDATASLSADNGVTMDVGQITMFNGLGSALVTFTGSGPFNLTATVNGLQDTDDLTDLTGAAVTAVSGTLDDPSGTTTWDGVVHVTGDVLVPAGHTLNVQPGTLVLLDGVASGSDGTDIEVVGDIQSLGTEDSPVTFTANNSAEAWGQIYHNNADPSLYQYTNIHLAGHSPVGGHTSTGPAVRPEGSTIVFEYTNITDNDGKVMQSTGGSDLTFRNSHLARSVMGPEIDNTALLLEDSWITENHGPDDNDGIYIHSQSGGQTCTLRGGVIADMHDDGLDTLQANVLVEDYIFRNMADKGVSVFGGEVTFNGIVSVDNDIGISAKDSSHAIVHLDHATITGNRLGIQAENKDGGNPNGLIEYHVTNSIVYGNTEWAVRSHYPLDPIDINYSIVGNEWISDGTYRGVADETHTGEIWPGTGNDNTDPLFADAAAGDFRLRTGSPAIDAGNDGKDLGYYADAPAVSPPNGQLTRDTVWRPDHGQIRVTENLTIPAAYTLTIMPGTTVFFEDGVNLTVQGRLLAEGTAELPIRFAPASGASNWDGIHFTGTMLDNRITHAIVEGSTRNLGMIALDNSNLLIDSVLFDNADRRRIRSDNSSLIVRNSTFADFVFTGTPPNNVAEHIWGGYVPAGGQFIIENNVFGVTPGHNDGIDFNAGNRAEGDPVPQILNNTFLGGGDDALDLEGDFHVEGNVFLHYRKDAYHAAVDSGESNVISAGDGDNLGHHYVVTRNVFYDADHVTLIKEGSFMTFTNNTVVNVDQGPHATIPGAINFNLPGETASPGDGAYVEGTIFTNTPVVFNNLDMEGTATDLVVNRSILPAAEHAYGTDNLDVDPRLADPAAAEFSLVPGSPAIGSGAVGNDRGATAPAGALVSPLPLTETYLTDATFQVAGDADPLHDPYVAYKYRLNGGAWSADQTPGTPITLSGLSDGPQLLEVLAKNSAGAWQDEADAVTRSWTVNTALSRVLINEVLAGNRTAHAHDLAYPDAVELYNDSLTTGNLAGWSISDDPANPTKFVFPAGTSIGSEQYLILYANDAPATGATGTYLGFQLDDDGEAVYLYDAAQTLVDSISFGLQVTDLSIGRTGAERTWALTQPTLGSANVAQPTVNPSGILINEWFANGDIVIQDDFIELYNPDTLPAPISGLYLTDNPVNQKTKHQIPPLSFIDAQGFQALKADNSTNPGHMDFQLRSHLEILGLFDADVNELDKIYYTPQTEDVSQGRTPDGTGTIEFFPLPTPDVANVAGPVPVHRDLRITELMYNPAGSDSREFIELQNTGTTQLDLTGLRFSDGIDFVFPAMTLDAGEYLVVARDVAAFEAFYGTGINVIGNYDPGVLSNGGEGILLQMPAPYEAAILRFDYSDTWYPSTDGDGASLVINDPLGPRAAWNKKEAWHPSGTAGGSPGGPDPVAELPLGSIVINEVLAHSDDPVHGDWIELYNTTGNEIDISGWFLSDDPHDLTKFTIPDETSIPDGGYIVFDQIRDFGAAFGLSEHGDEVLLSSSDGAGGLGTYREFAFFDATANSVTLGRHTISTGAVDFVALSSPTYGNANTAPLVGPLVIEQIMYHPEAGGAEYILLRNIFGSTVPLYDPAEPQNTWTLNTGGADFVFPENVTVPSGAYVLVTDVDPATYLATRSVPASVQVFGPLGDPLSNAGDTVTLSMPGTPEPTFVPYISVEQVKYNDTLPWPAEADGGGPALSKLADEITQYGNEPLYWGTTVLPVVTVDPLTTTDTTPQLTGTVTDTNPPAIVVVTVDGNDYTATVTGGTWALADNAISPPLTGNTYDITAAAFDVAGNRAADNTTDELTVDRFGITELVANPSGVVVHLNRPLDSADLNLYDVEAGVFGPADVTVVGDTVGAIRGSLIVGTHSVTFVATGGPLPADDYTVTLRGGAGGFKDALTGAQLDGNGDGTPGDDFTGEFTIGVVHPVVVSLPDFTRSPGQPVDLPATQEGLPVQLSEAGGVDSVEVTIAFDPTVLQVNGASVGLGMPEGATVVSDTSVAGQIRLTFTSDTPLAGSAEIATLDAQVLANATYNRAHVLAITAVDINQGAIDATADHAVHVVALVGDTTGNEEYSGLDAQRAARVAVHLDSGLEAYPRFDPLIIADVTGNGGISALDAQWIARVAVGLPEPGIPPVPQPLRLAVPAESVQEPSPLALLAGRGDGGEGSSDSLLAQTSTSSGVTDPGPPISDVGARSARDKLSYEDLTPVVTAALTHIESIDPQAAAKLQNVEFAIVDLPDNFLGLTNGNTIQIDVDAAGYGWNVEKNQANLAVPHSAFRIPHSVDLLTVVLHELGHVLGHGHEVDGLMQDTLPLGTRRLAEFDSTPEQAIDAVFASEAIV